MAQCRVYSLAHGSNTKNAPKPLWGMAAFASQRKGIVAGGSGQAKRHSPDNLDVLGTKRKHYWPQANLEAGKNLWRFRPKTSAR